MNIHKIARLTPSGRERIAQQIASGQRPAAVARAAGVSPRTARKWLDRYRREGLMGLQDRSSRPHRLYRPTPPDTVQEVERLRRQRFTGKQIAAELGISPATVSRILKRLGLNRIAALEPATPVRRYERAKPGEMIHIDIKKLGRFNRIGHRITGDRTGQSNCLSARGLGADRHVKLLIHLPVEGSRSDAYLQSALKRQARRPVVSAQTFDRHEH